MSPSYTPPEDAHAPRIAADIERLAAQIYKERAREIARESLLRVKNEALKERVERRRQASEIGEQLESEGDGKKERVSRYGRR